MSEQLAPDAPAIAAVPSPAAPADAARPGRATGSARPGRAPATVRAVVRKKRASRRKVIIGCAVIILLLAISYLAPLPFDPIATDPANVLARPSGTHWFGTDQLGRDVLARTIAAARLDIPLVLGSVLMSMVLGVGLGLAVSWKNRTSEYLMRAFDVFQAFPLLILVMAIVSIAHNSMLMIVVAVSLITFPLFLRLVRAESLALRESRFIEATIAIGASRRRVMFRHMLPNVSGIILVNAAVCASRAILIVAGLSFLGIGIQPPTPSWGQMMQQGSADIVTGVWWVALFPGLFVLLLGVVFNQVGDGLEAIFARDSRG